MVFTSDHGEMNGCHGLFQKGVMYDEAVRVPLMIRMPDQAQGVSVDYPFSTIDFLPTLLDLCAEPCPGAEGLSFAENLQNLDFPEDERSVFIEYHEDLCVVNGDYKLVADRARRPGALFDLKADPFEMTNLVAEPSYEKKVSQLVGELENTTIL